MSGHLSRRNRRRGSALTCLILLLLAGCDRGAIELAGTVERKVIELATPISEVIVELPVAEGERVGANEVVVLLDTEVATAELAACEASYSATDAALIEAKREYERQKSLRQSKVSSAQALDAARRRYDETVAAVAEKNARTAQARKRLRDLTLRSHAAGVVDQLPYEVGERVPAGGVVAVVVADEKPWVRVWLPARAVANAKPGTTAEVRVEGLQDPLSGLLKHVSREPEFTPHYALTERESAHLVYEARVQLEDAPADLRPGLPAQVRLLLGEG